MCTATADTTLPAETSVAAVSALSLSPKSSVGVADLLADPLGGSEGNAKLTSELRVGRPLLSPLDELLARVASCCPEVIELCLGPVSLPERVLVPGSCEAEGRGSGLGLGFEFARERPTTSVRVRVYRARVHHSRSPFSRLVCAFERGRARPRLAALAGFSSMAPVRIRVRVGLDGLWG